MTQKMYGVVLWADQSDQKAVIWCEDHGDLAYYHDTDLSAHEGVALDAGDLIQFDLRQERNLRLARNPERLARQQYAGIAQSLAKAGSSVPRPPAKREIPVRETFGRVVQFTPRREELLHA